jgi:hypothetical protein
MGVEKNLNIKTPGRSQYLKLSFYFCILTFKDGWWDFLTATKAREPACRQAGARNSYDGLGCKGNQG